MRTTQLALGSGRREVSTAHTSEIIFSGKTRFQFRAKEKGALPTMGGYRRSCSIKLKVLEASKVGWS